MVFTKTTQRAYVYTYVLLLQGMYKLTYRELIVAQEMVYRFVLLSEAQQKLKTEESRKKNNPFSLLKSERSLADICDKLDMNFLVFRKYVASLKNKGFFENGTINPEFIPKDKETIIKVQWI